MKLRAIKAWGFVAVTVSFALWGTILNWSNSNDGIFVGYFFLLLSGQYMFKRILGKPAMLGVGIEYDDSHAAWRNKIATVFFWLYLVIGFIGVYGYQDYIRDAF